MGNLRSTRRWLGASVLLVALAACQTAASELAGVTATAPLDYSVLITGGAFLTDEAGAEGTFVRPSVESGATAEAYDPIGVEEVVGILEQGRVFRRVALDPDPARRLAVCRCAVSLADESVQEVLRQAREGGHDLVLVLEELQDGPIEWQGINGRWPVTFVTWILLGVGMFIPDHTFESRAALRISMRDSQTGNALYDHLLTGGPVDLALIERTDLVGILTSILVPPFWVGNDQDDVRESVQDVMRRRLLVSLARELKSTSVRQRLREKSAAAITLEESSMLVVESAESLSSVRLRVDPELAAEEARLFSQRLLGSRQFDGARFRYRAELPAAVLGRQTQVLIATLRGAVASATLAPGAAR